MQSKEGRSPAGSVKHVPPHDANRALDVQTAADRTAFPAESSSRELARLPVLGYGTRTLNFNCRSRLAENIAEFLRQNFTGNSVSSLVPMAAEKTFPAVQILVAARSPGGQTLGKGDYLEI